MGSGTCIPQVHFESSSESQTKFDSREWKPNTDEDQRSRQLVVEGTWRHVPKVFQSGREIRSGGPANAGHELDLCGLVRGVVKIGIPSSNLGREIVHLLGEYVCLAFSLRMRYERARGACGLDTIAEIVIRGVAFPF